MQIVLNNNKALYVENGCYNSKCYNKNHVRVTWKFLGGGGVIKVPLGTEIPKGWGDANQKPSVGGVWIFSGTTQWRGMIISNIAHWKSGPKYCFIIPFYHK